MGFPASAETELGRGRHWALRRRTPGCALGRHL